jgi:hypothetical protein
MRHLTLLSLPLSLLIACGDKDGDDTSDAGGDVDEATDADGDGYAEADDCDDLDADTHPGATEVCDELDNNCDGAVDEGVTTTFYGDQDGDGWGAADRPVEACAQGADMATEPGDCDDANAAVNPDATEVCNGLDDDCDGDTDSADEDVDLSEAILWYADADADGHGDADDAGIETCDDPSDGGTQYALTATDCDDSDPGVSPDAIEICDDADVDEDCSGWADDADPGVDTSTASTWIVDGDDDGYGDDSDAGTLACDDPSTASVAYTTDASDCDDADATVSPDATEICDGIDNDCDGGADDADSDIDSLEQTAWYTDADADGFGDATSSTTACEQPSGMVADDTDCDDDASTTHPGAEILCGDATINDCDLSESDEAASCRWSTTHDLDSSDALLSVTGEPWATSLAHGDLDGDGVDEFAMGVMWTDDVDPTGSGTLNGYGAVYIMDGSQHGELEAEDAATELSGSDFNEFLGASLDVVPDLDGDGIDELLIGAPNVDYSTTRGAAYLVMGPFTAGVAASMATATWTGSSDDDSLGTLVRAAGDLDGDGVVDLLLGAVGADTDASNGGSLYIVSSTATGSASVSTASAEVYGDRSWDAVGYDDSADGTTDLDGDGQADLVLGAAYAEDEGGGQGVAYVFYGPLTGSINAEDADARLLGSNDNAYLGTAVKTGFDLDGDGTGDIALGAPRDERGGTDAGAVYVVSGELEGDDEAADVAMLSIFGTEEVAAGGTLDIDDQDGDGTLDILVGHGRLVHSGSSSSWFLGDDEGSSWLFLAPSTGSMSTSSASVTFGEAGDDAGVTARFLGDLGGDGAQEVGLLDPDRDGYDTSELFIFSGAGW